VRIKKGKAEKVAVDDQIESDVPVPAREQPGYQESFGAGASGWGKADAGGKLKAVREATAKASSHDRRYLLKLRQLPTRLTKCVNVIEKRKSRRHRGRREKRRGNGKTPSPPSITRKSRTAKTAVEESEKGLG